MSFNVAEESGDDENVLCCERERDRKGFRCFESTYIDSHCTYTNLVIQESS